MSITNNLESLRQKSLWLRKEIFPKNGDFVLLPSCLFHSTKPLKVDNSRDVIAFDLIPKRDKVKFKINLI